MPADVLAQPLLTGPDFAAWRSSDERRQTEGNQTSLDDPAPVYDHNQHCTPTSYLVSALACRSYVSDVTPFSSTVTRSQSAPADLLVPNFWSVAA
jgi:hypothetical protein